MATHSDVAHAWAHQTGKQKNGPSMYYEMPDENRPYSDIYSYGPNFIIARMYRKYDETLVSDKANVVMVNSYSYSNSTSKHQNYVGRSIYAAHQFYFPIGKQRYSWREDNPEFPNVFPRPTEKGEEKTREDKIHRKNLAYYLHSLIALGIEAKKRIYTDEDILYSDKRIQWAIDQVIEYLYVWKVRDLLTKELKPLKVIVERQEGYESFYTAPQEEIDAKRAKREKGQNYRKSHPPKPTDKQKAFVKKMEAWRNNEVNYFSHSYRDRSNLAALRLTPNGVIETSKGIRLQPEEAKPLFDLVRRAAENHETYCGNVKIHGYTLSGIDADGTLHVGCHTIGYESDIKPVAIKLGWLKETI